MKNIKYLICGFLLVLSITNIAYSQECMDFETQGSGANWQGGSILGIGNLQVIATPGSNTSNHLYFEDLSRESLAVNNVDFDGDWIKKGSDGCLCFDYRVNWADTTPSNRKGPNFWIYRIDSGQNISQINSVADWGNTFNIGNNSGLIAFFTPNPSNPTIPKNQWTKYCLPLNDPNGQIPSNTDGTWTIKQSIRGSGTTPSSVITLSGAAAISAWGSLISNVEGVILSADYHGNPNEEVSFDNFCWNCTGDPDPDPIPNPQTCCNIPGVVNVELTTRNNPRTGTQNLSLQISGITTPIQNIEVSLLDYHVDYGNDLCKPDNMGIFGNISSPNNSLGGLALTDNGTQSISWNPGTPNAFNGNINLNISKPNILNLPCCDGKMSFCLKVKITDVNCNVCEKIVCGSLDLKDKTLQQHDPRDVPVGLDPSNPIETPIPIDIKDLPNTGGFHFNEVTNPKTGKTWMDRNLGASQVATSPTDSLAYGDLYQWGRLTDGHEKRTSSTTTTLSSSDVPGHGDFIPFANHPFDWRSPQNNNLWQGVNGLNNPCPSGYRLPTEAELNAERLSWTTNDATGAFSSPLKWTVAGYRYYSNGVLLGVGVDGFYRSSTTYGGSALSLYFNGNLAKIDLNARAYGMAVRCIRN